MSGIGEKDDKWPEGEAIPTASIGAGVTGPSGKIGPYKLLSILGEGGFGIVYRAERKKPVRRQVALKVIKPGMDTKNVIARFETERQALALLDHPNIAHVFNAGTTELGRPYFVMEYVNGFSITEYCDRKKLSIEERLELFMQVCDAVQHAHHKGIIHRDLKPSNILMSVQDGKALPKIIDFGVAKAITQPLTERTLFTERGQLIGTPEYMSPEQAEMANEDIDTRSDIYSLGVLLYELLSGALPFNRKTLERAGLAEIQRIIREEDPPRPSTRLSSMGEKAKEIAKSRRTEVATLAKRLHKELEWIPLKAMRKERTRRYRSASEFADDIRNYLNDAPLVAGPESTVYRVRKFVRRNRATVTSIVAVAVVLVVGLIVSTAMYLKAEAMRIEADQAREKEAIVRSQAVEAKNQAVHQRDLANQRLVQMYVNNSLQLIEEGDLTGSLVWCAEAIWLNPIGSSKENIERIRFAMIQKQCPALDQIWFHEEKVYYAEFSPDGRHVVTASGDNTARVWNIQTGKPVTAPLAHEGDINHASFSPDGRFVVTASDDKTARIWDAGTGIPAIQPLTHKGSVLIASFNPNGRQIATVHLGRPSEACIWDVATGKAVVPSLKHVDPKYGSPAEIWYASFSPDGRQLVTASNDGWARIWNAADGKPVSSFKHGESTLWKASFSPDSRRVATAGINGITQVWEATTGKTITPPLKHDDGVFDVSFSPDGNLIVTASEDKTAQLWDASSGKPITPALEHRGQVFSASFSHDGKYVVTGSEDGTARVWDSATGQPVTPFLKHNHAVRRVSFSPDDYRVVTASNDGTARVWKVAIEEPFIIPLTYVASVFGSVRDASFSDDGLFIVTVGREKARVWSAVTGQPVSPVLVCHKGVSLISASISPDSNYVVTTSGITNGHGEALIWDINTGQAITPPLIHPWPVLYASFSPDGRCVVTASGNIMLNRRDKEGIARVWNAATGEPCTPPLKHALRVNYASFSPDGRFVVTASDDKTAKVWDAKTGRQVIPPLSHEGKVNYATFSPDGHRVVTASGETYIYSGSGFARIWDAKTGAPITQPLEHKLCVRHASFSPNGRYIVTASDDKTARIWDAETGIPVTQPLTHNGIVIFASFSRDGRFVATASYDKTARIWDAETGKPVTPPLRHTNGVIHAYFKPDRQHVITTTSKSLQVWNLSPDNRPVQDIKLIAQILASRQIDNTGSLAPLQTSEFRKAWRTIRTKYSDEYLKSTQDVPKQQP